MITKFKLFEINGYITSEKFGTELTESEFDKLYSENCKINQITKTKLYRGMNSKLKYIYQNPKGHIRHSIERENIHNTLMSELKSWQYFPPYNQSIIGANDTDVSGYGYAYEIIPYDNTKIGFCPFGNVWSSFGGFQDTNKIRLTNKFLEVWINYACDDEDFESIKRKIMEKDVLKTFEEKEESIHINNFFDSLIYYCNTKKFDRLNSYYIPITEKKDLINSLYITPGKIIEFIEYMFDPKLNGFDWVKYDKNFDKNINEFITKHENIIQIWCGGPVLLKKL